jgi:hypothetical protein
MFLVLLCFVFLTFKLKNTMGVRPSPFVVSPARSNDSPKNPVFDIWLIKINYPTKEDS